MANTNSISFTMNRRRTFFLGAMLSLPLACGVKVDLLTTDDGGVQSSTGGTGSLGGSGATGGQALGTGGSVFVPPTVTVDDETLISLQRTACFGTCPVYTVTIDGMGNVNYSGEQYVQVTGSASSQIPVADVQRLVDWMMSVNYLALEVPDTCPNSSTDMPSAITSLKVMIGHNTIDHYHGNPCAPRYLGLVEDLIDQTANTARWINGTNLLGTGAPCSLDSECSTGVCFGEGGAKTCSAPVGEPCLNTVPCFCNYDLCAKPCSQDADCPLGDICNGSGPTYCVRSCTVGSGDVCPTNWRCEPVEHQGGTATACVPFIN